MTPVDYWSSLRPVFEAKLDEASRALSEWQPTDPVEYTDPWETNLPPEPIYSDRDIAEHNRLVGDVQRRTYELNMARYAYEWRSMYEYLSGLVAQMDREVKDAIANSRWTYQPPDPAGGGRLREDELLSQVRLEMQRFEATRRMSLGAMRNSRQEVSVQEHVLDELRMQLTEVVYGFTHRPIDVSKTVDVEFDVPSSWWQMFKRDVLRRPYSIKTLKRATKLRVSAAPFSAFPELPFVPPPEWGSRIDMMVLLPSRVTHPARLDQ